MKLSLSTQPLLRRQLIYIHQARYQCKKLQRIQMNNTCFQNNVQSTKHPSPNQTEISSTSLILREDQNPPFVWFHYILQHHVFMFQLSGTG